MFCWNNLYGLLTNHYKSACNFNYMLACYMPTCSFTLEFIVHLGFRVAIMLLTY